MAKTNIKKNASGYGYKYTDLAEIHNHLEEEGVSYYQYIEPVDGVDYIWTVLIVDGKEEKPRRGCRIIEAKLSGKDNPVQAYGASLTYCRRYSLLMAAGLATTDDDAACLTVEEKQTYKKQKNESKEELVNQIQDLAKQKGIPVKSICEQGGVKSIGDMVITQMQSCITWLRGLEDVK